MSMTSNVSPLAVPAVRLVNVKQTPVAIVTQQSSGSRLPVSWKAAAKPSPTLTTWHPRILTANKGVVQSQVALLNKYLNNLGHANRFRIGPNSGDKLIQELDPATGEVIAEFSIDTFPALAKSLGLVGSLVDGHA
jgi:hypothetical protein